jgi:WD40 repeat protein
METLAWSPDGSQLVTGSINGLITFWDATTLTQITQFATTSSYPVDPLTVSDEVLNRYWIRDTAFNVDGVIETVSGDGTVRQWDTQGNLLQETQIGQLETAAWSPYGARLAVQMPSQTSSNGLRTVSGDTFRIEVPFASMDQLNAIAALCVRDASTQSRAVTGLTSQRVTSLNALPDFVAQVESLPEGAIPAACRADLLAVADALR